MSTPTAQAIGIDVGGTKTAALRVSAEGEILAREALATPADDMQATLDTMAEAARAVLSPEVRAIGVGAAGLVEAGTGRLIFAPNLAWRNALLTDHLWESIGLPAFADNDNNVAAWGEYRHGAARGYRHVLFVGVGTGIGGGIIVDGKLLRGAHGFAAEIGHIIVEPAGPLCGCGNHGCWEQVASGHALTRAGRDAASQHPQSMIARRCGGDPSKVSGPLVTEAARAGDPVARGILARVGRRLGEGIAGLVNVLDPEVVVVGGGVAAAGDLLMGSARIAFSTSVEASAHRPEVPLLVATLGNDAGAVGAATLALEELGVKLGISLPVFTADVGKPLSMAARCAGLGVDGVFSPDHLFPPVFYPPSGPERPALEPFTLLAAVSARHPELAVGTLVTRVTLRPAGLLAKEAAALDEMSGGRAILALGAGDRASLPEHETFGIPFPSAADRVALLEETTNALRALFDGRAWEGGPHVPAMTGPLLPSGEPSLWVGGLSDAVLGVAARTADAWNGWGLDADTFAEKASRLRELAEGREVSPTWGGIALVGEDDEDLARLKAIRAEKGFSLDGVWTGSVADLRAFAGRLEDAGASWLVVLPVGPADRVDVIARTLRP